MRRILRSFSLPFFAVALLALGELHPAPASAAQAQGADRPTVSVLVELSHGVPIVDAMKIAESFEEPVVGYRYENLGVVGEIYLSESRSLEGFGERFLKRYGTQLRIVGLLVDRAYDVERKAPAEGPSALDVAGEDFVPAAADTSALTAGRDSFVQDLEDVEAAGGGGGGGGSASTAPGLMMDDPPSTDWYPDATSVEIERDDDLVLFQEYVYWDDHEPTDAPAGFGLEVEVNL